jgi:hypothetical protein
MYHTGETWSKGRGLLASSPLLEQKRNGLVSALKPKVQIRRSLKRKVVAPVRRKLPVLGVVLAGNPAGLAIVKPVTAEAYIFEALAQAAELVAHALLFHAIAHLAGKACILDGHGSTLAPRPPDIKFPW